MAAPQRIDYDRIEPDWRAGRKSLDQLAEEYTAATGAKVTKQAIRKHFKAEGIERDLLAKIQHAADAKVVRLATEEARREAGRASRHPNEAEIVSDNADLLAQVRMGHRREIEKARKIASGMFDELAPAEIEDEKPLKLYDRASVLKSLVDSLKSLIGLERQAFGIVDASKPDDTPYEEQLRALAQGPTP